MANNFFARIIKSPVFQIFVFWTVAFLTSLLLHNYMPSNIAQFLYPGLNVLSFGWGPAIAVLTIFVLSQLLGFKFKMYGLFGFDKWYKSLAIFLTPIVAVVAFRFLNLSASGGAENSIEYDLRSAFLVVSSIMIYCIGEEIGWRGWLLKRLENFDYIQQSIIIWLLWLPWHFAIGQPIDLVFILALLGASFGINIATRKTGSILVASGMHAALNLFSYFPKTMIIIIPIWILLFISYDQTKNSENQTKKSSKIIN